MFLDTNQINELINVFLSTGLNINDFNYTNDNCFEYYRILDKNHRFNVRKSIYGYSFCDVYCNPYTYTDSIYHGCNSFDECLCFAREWANVMKFKLLGKTYYNKIFISHSSKDKTIIDEFIDKILRLSCGYNNSDLVYTSLQATGVEPGEGIPSFIKDNLNTSSLVMFMISQNYKDSEVCLNEMGAAWALNKKTVSILLPNTSFNNLGWLTSFDKAIKIDDGEGLDRLIEMISRKDIDISDWNRQKERFLKSCVKHYKCSPKAEMPVVASFNNYELNNSNDALSVFDIRFYVRAVNEGEYQYQLNMRLRCNRSITLKELCLINKSGFVGNVSNPSNSLKLKTFIPMGYIDINHIASSEYESEVSLAIDKNGKKIMDMFIDKEKQISISSVGGFQTIRECDGYVDLPINEWNLSILYNIDESIIIPVKLEYANGNISRYFWHN